MGHSLQPKQPPICSGPPSHGGELHRRPVRSLVSALTGDRQSRLTTQPRAVTSRPRRRACYIRVGSLEVCLGQKALPRTSKRLIDKVTSKLQIACDSFRRLNSCYSAQYESPSIVALHKRRPSRCGTAFINPLRCPSNSPLYHDSSNHIGTPAIRHFPTYSHHHLQPSPLTHNLPRPTPQHGLPVGSLG